MNSGPAPFLKLVAEAYAIHERELLSDCCFVFPNKRSAVFFTSYLDKEMSGKTYISPALETISELVSEFSTSIDASRYEQLFILYNEYAKLSGEVSDFDKFMFWGDMLLSDFNDVDRYMVDAEMLFTNVERLKEINSNYLTEEQLKAVKRYWGDERPGRYLEQFWSHIHYNEDDDASNGGHKANKKFLKLWEVLAPLYRNFRSKLREAGLSTSGMHYREAAERLRQCHNADLPYKRYIFCGFNVLSTSELSIFNSFKKLGAGDYYWDYNSPAFKIPQNKAGRFIEKNIRDFPSRYDIDNEEITSFPEINILGVPSNAGQTKAAGQFISDMIADGSITDRGNAINTAVVLPDENLFIPMIHSIPFGKDRIESLNVTMGFPMRLSPISALIHTIVSMQMKARMHKGELSFFHEDVRALLTTPSIYSVAPDECEQVFKEIAEKRLYMVPVSTLAASAPVYTLLFTPIGPKSGLEQVREYLMSVLDFVENTIPPAESGNKLQIQFIDAYRQAVTALYDAAKLWKIDMRDLTFFQLAERTINSAKINFKGEPLRGLQIMGMLETRSLDFENVIVLSMNERIFPRKQYTRSFIPEALRRAYGMATADFQESIFAYYFYRLLSRARKVWLTYDARSVGGTRSSEMSRYLTQLLYLYPEASVKHKLATFRGLTFKSPEIRIDKTTHIMKLLERFTIKNSGYNLSPSALNTYISCPLEFYLKYVRDYRVDNEVTDYMDSSTYGTILHEAAQNFYENLSHKGCKEITADTLKHYTRPENRHIIERIITQSINKNFNLLKDDKLDTPLVGEALVLGKVMLENIIVMLKAEIPYAPITFIGAEHELKSQFEVNQDLKINVRLFIDRIDEVNGVRRFVDYKTGRDVLSASDVDSLFDSSIKDRPKGIMQLMFYCTYYRMITGDNQPVQPIIYQMRRLGVDGIKPITIGNIPVTDYHNFVDTYETKLRNLIEEIFNPHIPFTQAENEDACVLCEFKRICLREGVKY